VLHRENRLPVPGGVGAVNTVPVNGYHEDGVEANFEIIYQRWCESNAAQYDKNSGFKSPQEFLMSMGVDEKEYYKYIPGDYVEAIKLLERAMKEISTD
ncbi:hypothetical protein, partial [Aeromonas hydrophila]